MFKTAFMYFIIILDVMIFPFSCMNTRNTRQKYIYHIGIYDETHEYSYTMTSSSEYVVNQTAKLDTKFIEKVNEHIAGEYEILGWYVYKFESEEDIEKPRTLVTFPYNIQEDDYLPYWQGKRNVVVFYAEWVYIGNADA